MTIWFTSDQHYSHRRICEYAKRPFKDVTEMDQVLVENYNRCVKPSEVCYVLGDFSFMRPDTIPALVKQLHGTKHLVRGNHDRFLSDKRRDFGFAWVGDYKEIKIDAQKIILCHYAFRVWSSRHHGSWNLHGHSHGSLPIDMGNKQLDVGVDAVAKLFGGRQADYRPISFDEVKVEMDKRTIGIVDHHEMREQQDEDESA